MVGALLIGGALAVALGAIDDLFDLRARWQLLGQIALALGAVAAGVTSTSSRTRSVAPTSASMAW
jgi:UDP-N-acetylmuramyl pentapeptide phosphotransferase/UDP-N-acetylglucosamine-1-phosphate transferase